MFRDTKFYLNILNKMIIQCKRLHDLHVFSVLYFSNGLVFL